MLSNLHVLVIGLDPYRVPGPWDPKPVADAIELGMTALADRGLHAEACLVGLDGSDDVEARVTTALQGRSWDCVVVGGGIRHPEEQLELFESIINLIRRHAPQGGDCVQPHTVRLGRCRGPQSETQVQLGDAANSKSVREPGRRSVSSPKMKGKV